MHYCATRRKFSVFRIFNKKKVNNKYQRTCFVLIIVLYLQRTFITKEQSCTPIELQL